MTDDHGSGKPAVLFSYRRPELTRSAISRIAQYWEGPIIVSIDGLRPYAPNDEREWHRQTVISAEQVASNFPNVEVVVWNANKGLTDHACRIFQRVLEEYEAIIALEEDVCVSRKGMQWLHTVTKSGGPILATAMTRFEHTQVSPVTATRRTAFPAQWSTAFNRPLFEEFARVWRGKEIEKSVIDDVVGSLIRSRVLAWAARDYWYSLFRDASKSQNHGDALFQYASWSLGCLTLVPDKSFVTDLGPEDFRGIHQRTEADDHVSQHVAVPEIWDSGSWVCLRCESISQKRSAVSPLAPIRRRLRIRSRVTNLRYLQRSKT